MYIEKLTSGPIETNAFLLADENSREALVVDAPPGALDAIVRMCERAGFRLVFIVNTHGHWDHVADNSALKKATGATLAIHKLDAPLLATRGADGFQLPFSVEPSFPDRMLSEGDAVGFGDVNLEVMHTPGHTKGSICLYSKRDELLLTGDTLFDAGYGRTDLPGSSEKNMENSLKRLSLLPAATRVYPGHGELTTIGRQSWLGMQ